MKWCLQFGFFPDAHTRDQGIANVGVKVKNAAGYTFMVDPLVVPAGLIPPSPQMPQGGQASVLTVNSMFEPSSNRIWGNTRGGAPGYWVGSSVSDADLCLQHSALSPKHIGFSGDYVGPHQNQPQMNVDVSAQVVLLRGDQPFQLEPKRYIALNGDTFVFGPQLFWVKMIVVEN